MCVRVWVCACGCVHVCLRTFVCVSGKISVTERVTQLQNRVSYYLDSVPHTFHIHTVLTLD